MIFGFCMGGAMAVAMACDLRFAAEGSKFGIPAARLSIIYGADAVGQLVDLVGPAYAKDILYSARTVGDREALAMGFIQRLLPPDELEIGTFVGLHGLVRGLERLGHVARVRPLRTRTHFHTLDRWLYNAGGLLWPPAGDVVVGVDLDGFLWARRRRVPFVVMLKGVIADELTNERGVVRALLTVQARWERLNTERADRVIVASRYSASVAAEVYRIPPEKLAVVPEPIDLAEWRRRLARAERRASGRPTVLAVARMYPPKHPGGSLPAA